VQSCGWVCKTAAVQFAYLSVLVVPWACRCRHRFLTSRFFGGGDASGFSFGLLFFFFAPAIWFLIFTFIFFVSLRE